VTQTVGYGVMFHPDRAKQADDLRRQLPPDTIAYAAIEPLATATDHTSVWRTKAAVLRGITDHKFRCVLQEDIELAPDFLNRVEKLVEAHGQRCVYALHFRATGKQKANNLRRAELALADGKDYFITTRGYVRGQGIIIPSAMASAVIIAGDTWSAAHPLDWDDDVMKHVLRDLNIQTVAPIPSLVEHVGGHESTAGFAGERKAWWFG
jgi:hypothetical protein